MLLRSLRLAALSLVRQPTRAILGVLGVAAVGALLFDMLLLSRGLVLSFRDLLDRVGFDVRVLASDSPAFSAPPMPDATRLGRSLSALPEVEAVVRLRFEDVEIEASSAPASGDDRPDGVPARHVAGFIGAGTTARSLWTIVEGRDLSFDAAGDPTVIVNRHVGQGLGVGPGSSVWVRGRCAAGSQAMPPVRFTVAGIADFAYDSGGASTLAGRLEDLLRVCGAGGADVADLFLVRSRVGAGADAVAARIRQAHPELHVLTNEDLVERFSRIEFSYFRQLSVVLATVTLFFGFLLIAVLLTVSVNQRLGEIAALRALGLSRARVVSGVLVESALLVGAGGALAVPLGAALSFWLDGILRAMPGVPVELRFFVFEPRALAIHAALLLVAAIGAAAYPMWIVAVLPIAATLRREVVS
jgi:putative ABC transport system permease protein